QLYNTTDLAGTMGDVNENLRAAANVITRDLSTCGWELGQSGIPIPYGGTATRIIMPGPPLNSLSPANATANDFPSSQYLPILTPGPGYGQSTGSGGTLIPTDQITIITVNPLISTLSITTAPTITATAATVTTTTSPSQIS